MSSCAVMIQEAEPVPTMARKKSRDQMSCRRTSLRAARCSHELHGDERLDAAIEGAAGNIIGWLMLLPPRPDVQRGCNRDRDHGLDGDIPGVGSRGKEHERVDGKPECEQMAHTASEKARYARTEFAVYLRA